MRQTFDETFWKSIAENDYALPEGYDLDEMTAELLSYLGASDPKVRDDIAYGTFYHWIVRDKHYTPDQLRKMRDQLLKNLKKDIGSSGDNSVLLRSFSALILSVIVYHDNEVDFLTVDEVEALVWAANSYLLSEWDIRGYEDDEDEIGWIHAVAHTADWLKFLVRSEKTHIEHHVKILNAIASAVMRFADYVYSYNEDERLALAIYEVLKRDLVSFGDWYQWSQRFEAWHKENSRRDEFDVTVFHAHQNAKALMRSLYFRLERVEELSITAQKVRNEAHELSKLFSL